MASALLLLDAQKNMLHPPAPVPDAQAVTAVIDRLLASARNAGALVIHVRNNGGPDDPDAPGASGWELAAEALDSEQIVDKHERNAFAGTHLAELLPPGGNLVLAGMQSEYCIRETALGAVELGYSVSLVRGAHATYDDELPAEEASRNVEQELEAAGVCVVDPATVTFS
ncbi:MAG TPA: isochorismatase family protein [Solirubrobacteraceae bacterium]